MSSSTLTLSNDVQMPVIGLGTWQSKPEEVTAAVKTAIKAGYRLIDTAAVYQNEEAIGTAIKEAIEEGLVTREQLFVITKASAHELSPGGLEEGLRGSLKRLGLEYVDLFLAWMPIAFSKDIAAHNDLPVELLWRQMDAVYKASLAKALGVTNWNEGQIARALAVGLTPIHVSQVELHLYFPQHEHVEYCRKHNITVTSYATLGSPGRINFTLPTGEKLDWPAAQSELEDVNVWALAEKYGKTPAQVLLRYALDRGVAIIPKSVDEGRILENFDIFDFKLTTDEIAKMEETKVSQRLFLHDFLAGHSEDVLVNERE